MKVLVSVELNNLLFKYICLSSKNWNKTIDYLNLESLLYTTFENYFYWNSYLAKFLFNKIFD